MSSLANQGYLQDKQTGDKPPAYPNQTYHPSNPPYNAGQYQPQPQPQVVHVERREDRGGEGGLCAAACCLGLCAGCCCPCWCCF